MSTGIMSCLPLPLLLLLLLLSGVVLPATTTSTVTPLRTLLTEVVTEAVRENCAGPDLSLHARISAGPPPQEQQWRCSCPSGFIPCAGGCYTRLLRAVDYEQAEKDCAAIGAHLAVPRSRDQNLCVAGLAGLEHAWLGVTDREQEGVFQGADGRPITSSDGQVWAPNQPDNSQEEDCVHIITQPLPEFGFRFAEWNDAQCTGASYFPMCELPGV